MHHQTDRITHTMAFVTPVVEHCLEREIAHEGSIRRTTAPCANALSMSFNKQSFLFAIHNAVITLTVLTTQFAYSIPTRMYKCFNTSPDQLPNNQPSMFVVDVCCSVIIHDRKTENNHSALSRHPGIKLHTHTCVVSKPTFNKTDN